VVSRLNKLAETRWAGANSLETGGSVMATRKELASIAPERISRAEFDELVPIYSGMRTCLMDADLARHILEAYNTGNRRISSVRVARLVQQMSSGEFQNTGEPIILSREGVLNDGQHRLQAIVDADVTVEIDVRFGIPRSVFPKTDTGAARTGGDVLSIAGASHGSLAAQAVRLLVLYERGLPGSVRDYVSNAQVAAAYDRWPDVAEAVDRLHGRAFPKGIRSAPLTCTVFLAQRAPGKRKLDEWLEVLETGVSPGKSDPAHQLREYLIRGADAGAGTREAMLERWGTMLRSWMLYRAGGTVTARDLRWRMGKDEFPMLNDAKL
jgi:hypothetical protein